MKSLCHEKRSHLRRMGGRPTRNSNVDYDPHTSFPGAEPEPRHSAIDHWEREVAQAHSELQRWMRFRRHQFEARRTPADRIRYKKAVESYMGKRGLDCTLELSIFHQTKMDEWKEFLSFVARERATAKKRLTQAQRKLVDAQSDLHSAQEALHAIVHEDMEQLGAPSEIARAREAFVGAQICARDHTTNFNELVNLERWTTEQMVDISSSPTSARHQDDPTVLDGWTAYHTMQEKLSSGMALGNDEPWVEAMCPKRLEKWLRTESLSTIIPSDPPTRARRNLHGGHALPWMRSLPSSSPERETTYTSKSAQGSRLLQQVTAARISKPTKRKKANAADLRHVPHDECVAGTRRSARRASQLQKLSQASAGSIVAMRAMTNQPCHPKLRRSSRLANKLLR